MSLRSATRVRYGIALLTFSIFFSFSLAIAHGENLYRMKCAQCHGKNGQGKPSIKAPSLVSKEAKKMSDPDIESLISARMNGETEKRRSHTFWKKRLTTDQVGQLIAEIRAMQGKHD